jgi:Ca2+-binding EF-hand superfamily protein
MTKSRRWSYVFQNWHKGFQKDFPSGEVDKSQFIQMYRTLFPNGNAEKFSQNMFRILDTNNSGTIDFREFMLALHLTTNGTPEKTLALAFRMYDLDGNGFIDFLEMKRWTIG